ncbi:MAG: restriction endonuclease subunit S [Nitrosomonas sp.]|uniref:restriction endonuclease subunit S n=1 Tax=Nitrosomonas sp. TaxID=42353 RepID=UPI002730A9E8|nr:restriction endonuclease subunit S [Nitrosomonas sp.]MDP1550938.1 restriction endonuclease subunit S [Nitrosomonas sp.]
MSRDFVPIGEVVKSANTGLDAIKRAPIVDRDTGIKCLRIQDVSQRKKYDNWGNTEVEKRNFEKFQLKTNDIIVARTGASIGVNLIIKENLNSVLNNGLIRIRVDYEKCHPDYLYYNFRSSTYNDFIESISGGTSTQPNMQINALLSYKINLPPLEEQKAIAAVLSSLDDKIDLLHRQNKTLEAMAEALFRQWFVEETQEDWKAGTLGDVVNFNYGKTLKDQERSGSGYPVVGSSGVVGFHKNFLVEAPGIVTGRKGTLGVVNYFFDNFFPIDTTFYITSKIQSDGMFYEYFLVKSVGLGDMNSDSAVPGLNRNAAHAIPVTIPPSELVRSFNNFCKPTFAKINTNIRQIQTLEKLRDTLLPKLMSGEIRINYA